MRLVKDNVVKIKTDKPSIKRLIEAGYVSDDAKPKKTEQPKVDKTQDEQPDYSSMTYSELQAAAKDKGIVHVGVKKAELLEALQGGQD